MKATWAGEADTLRPLAAAPSWRAQPRVLFRLMDYWKLTKPRIAVMALFTVAAGYWLGAGLSASPRVLVNTLIGAGLLAAGGSALNQLFERAIDARMWRTRNRPLPAGRVTPQEVAIFGAVLCGVGSAYLTATVPAPAALVATLTAACYVLIYTPLKTRTVWNTVVGAVPGALPPVIGWCAARGHTDLAGAAVLFLVLFFWQVPHFLAIAWMFRDDYARGGLRMLPGMDPSGSKTAAVMVVTTTALVPLGFLAMASGLAGWVSAVGVAVFGCLFLRKALAFARARTDAHARAVLRGSLFYLPGVFSLFLLESLLLR